jgi:hypothetical protein
MREENFIHAVNELAAFLGSREIPAHTKMAWLEKVRNIPDEALRDIVSKIQDECDSMPRNLPKVMREKWRVWQMEHPEKCVEVKELGCPDCEGGVLFLTRDGVPGVVFCQCYTGNVGNVGRSTLAYMRRQGWESTKVVAQGTSSDIKAKVAGYINGARKAEQDPDEGRYDGYEDRYDAENW